ncbi:hypothetical protein [uncultured Allofournierella sp.]|uniref:hypothetical protein n=1 Tax=uncultured Allofournierella sp. TaxID=1940258 RepID=UPI0025E02294|nr:hypothetical protein [uncultured Fournierella sp.]
MKQPIRWLAAAYLAVLALWLILSGVSLGKSAWYAHKGMKAQTELAWQDLTGVGVQELEGQGEGVWYVSTDTDPQLHWTAPNPEGIYLETVELRVEQLTPGQAVVLYWKEPGQADFSAAQMVYAQKVADGVYRFDLGGCVVSEIRLDPDSVGGVTTRFNGVTLNPAEGWYTAFVPTATGLVLGLLAPPVAVAVLWELWAILEPEPFRATPRNSHRKGSGGDPR